MSSNAPPNNFFEAGNSVECRNKLIVDNKICPFCHGEVIRPKYIVGEHKILRCQTCTLMWLNKMPSPDDLKLVYDDGYFGNKNFITGKDENLFGYYDYLAERFTRQNSYLRIINKSKNYLPNFQPNQSKFLDVGCGLGYLMDAAHDARFDVRGVEFNEAALKILKGKYVFKAECCDILDYKEKNFDVVAMMDVIEHLLNPFATVSKLNKILNRDGILIITTMDSDGLVSRILGTKIEDFRRVKEHLFFFTRKSLRTLLEKNNFEILDIQYYGHTFKLDFLQNRLKLISPVLAKIFGFFVSVFRANQLTIDINPRTKMIVYARKK
jgi:2-polyprenyl-3-methyl-5-hydroxy-6-metoxy-1,4-benzoquinol methylase